MGRLDVELVERGLFESREKAKRAIMAGTVEVNGELAHKANASVKPTDQLTVRKSERFVSRGGLKLQHALEAFHIDVIGQAAIDLGASTGGFTDCLLQNGAAKVYAVDVGYGQLAWKLRNDARVQAMEKLNARALTRSHFDQAFQLVDLVVIDCSFISLRKILPAAVALLKPFGKIIALIKPQFEAGKAEADRGAGVIRDPEIHRRILSELEQFVSAVLGLQWRQVSESPILGPAGNKEFLVLIENSSAKH
jgi:23S rRNA (cytidine1920-2'-O)/16S rRNA (cytidine1409-2'-O)-methyltransferase